MWNFIYLFFSFPGTMGDGRATGQHSWNMFVGAKGKRKKEKRDRPKGSSQVVYCGTTKNMSLYLCRLLFWPLNANEMGNRKSISTCFNFQRSGRSLIPTPPTQNRKKKMRGRQTTATFSHVREIKYKERPWAATASGENRNVSVSFRLL